MSFFNPFEAAGEDTHREILSEREQYQTDEISGYLDTHYAALPYYKENRHSRYFAFAGLMFCILLSLGIETYTGWAVYGNTGACIAFVLFAFVEFVRYKSLLRFFKRFYQYGKLNVGLAVVLLLITVTTTFIDRSNVNNITGVIQSGVINTEIAGRDSLRVNLTKHQRELQTAYDAINSKRDAKGAFINYKDNKHLAAAGERLATQQKADSEYLSGIGKLKEKSLETYLTVVERFGFIFNYLALLIGIGAIACAWYLENWRYKAYREFYKDSGTPKDDKTPEPKEGELIEIHGRKFVWFNGKPAPREELVQRLSNENNRLQGRISKLQSEGKSLDEIETACKTVNANITQYTEYLKKFN